MLRKALNIVAVGLCLAGLVALASCKDDFVVPPENQLPTVAMTTEFEETDPLRMTVNFTISAIDPDGSVASLVLDFGDDNFQSIALDESTPISHTYDTVQEYTAEATATDDVGAVASATAVIDIGGGLGACCLGCPTSDTCDCNDNVTQEACDNDAGSFVADAACADQPSPCLACPDVDMDDWAVCDDVCTLATKDTCGDCNDNDPSIHPGADEFCSVDMDCDGVTPVCCFDTDNDSYAVCDGICAPEQGKSCGDCNDGSAAINPGAVENCPNGSDDDCDGEIDECDGCADNDNDGFVVCMVCNPGQNTECGDCEEGNPFAFPGAAQIEDPTAMACMRDADNDGYGDINAPPGGQAGTDCDDSDGFTFPGAAQVEDPTAAACMRDADNDGYGDTNAPASGDAGTDCNDNDGFTFPGAAQIEDPLAMACMRDMDNDGYGDVNAPQGGDPGMDCNDASQFISPGAAETCGNDTDDDCDSLVDDCDVAECMSFSLHVQPVLETARRSTGSLCSSCHGSPPRSPYLGPVTAGTPLDVIYSGLSFYIPPSPSCTVPLPGGCLTTVHTWQDAGQRAIVDQWIVEGARCTECTSSCTP